MERIRHDCAASHLEPPIEYLRDIGVWAWGYSGVNNPSRIAHCPYCGVKLEKPQDPKPVVSEEQLRGVAQAITDGYNEWTRQMKALLVYEEPEPPDVKVEVNREMLELVCAQAAGLHKSIHNLVGDLDYMSLSEAVAKILLDNLRSMLGS